MQLPELEEVVILERIELIARLGGCYESKPKDKDMALTWISELAEGIRNHRPSAQGKAIQ
ncbi:hypothetical protein M8578_001444 [Serratia marcescens]